MPGLHHCALIALLACCDAFRSGPSQIDLPPRFHGNGPHLFQEHVRPKRQVAPELVQVHPRLVHDMRQPEIHQLSSSTVKMEPLSSTHHVPTGVGGTHDAGEENQDVEDEMERMVHLTVSRGTEYFGENLDFSDSETDVLGGTGDVSLESSGFYGSDAEDREKREGEDEWEKNRREYRKTRAGDAIDENNQDVLHGPEANRTEPDLDAMIGYSPSTFEQHHHLLPAEELSAGLQEHRGPPVLEVDPLQRDLWKVEEKAEEEVQSSGDGVLHTSITESTASSTSTGTSAPETDTGTDFGLLGSFTLAAGQTEVVKTEREEEEEEEEEEAGLLHTAVFTQNPTAAEVGLAPSREPLQPSVEEEEEQLQRDKHVLQGSKPVEGEESRTERTTVDLPSSTNDWLEMTTPLQTRQQVVCLDWSELAGRGYVVLNMTQNFNCEEFRVHQGVGLLKTLERVFARRMNSPEGSWMIYLSKPTHQQHQLLMNVASERGVIGTKDVLSMLGEISKHLQSLSIQNFSAANTCHSRPSQTRSDYGKLFVVLVIIGSICVVIITSGIIYICWQRRLPATKTQFRAEELHFVENGCHDNPTLDVTNDGQAEMQEKKPSTNGLAGGGEGGGEECSRWQVFVNQAATEDDEEEQDTHL
ncbi:podocalyxin-like protein 2 [Gouania willdenowi]|uniref:Podocalyxin-like protein 2 n=1 Tax=Gouania willdenowi TaxID=441366 RepID=A0A8C5D3N4_GOUWI|nr:podocalyxin-like protein 2 [Gouania willdenowi]